MNWVFDDVDSNLVLYQYFIKKEKERIIDNV